MLGDTGAVCFLFSPVSEARKGEQLPGESWGGAAEAETGWRKGEGREVS